MPPSPNLPPLPPPLYPPPLPLPREGSIDLSRSTNGQLHRLLKVRDAITNTSDHWPVAVARSYDGLPWERLQYSGEYDQGRVVIGGCSPDSCTLILPAASGYSYRLEIRTPAVEDGRIGTERAAAQLLLTGTFGPRRSEIAELSRRLESSSKSDAAETWVRQQMALSPTLHRAFFRRRANMRVDPEQRTSELRVGQSGERRACELHSRWHRYALTMADVGKPVTISVGADGKRTLRVNGTLRTVILAKESAARSNVAFGASDTSQADFSFDTGNALGVTESMPWKGHICRVMERIGLLPASNPVRNGGGVDLNPSIKCDSAENIRVSRPPLWLDLDTADPTTTLLPLDSEAELTGIPWIGRAKFVSSIPWKAIIGPTAGGANSQHMAKATHDEVAILTKWSGVCTLGDFAQRTLGHAFMIYNGSTYMHDPRMRTIDLSLESVQGRATTATSTGNHGELEQQCMSAPRTHLNTQSCRAVTTCKSSAAYRSISVRLDHSSLRTFHNASSSYVYAVTGLALEVSSPSPCVGPSRWVRHLTGPCGADETPLDNATKATLASAIRSSADAPNLFVRDAVVSSVAGGHCMAMSDYGISPIGAKVEVDGRCWEHAHPLSLNVYEMNEWAKSGHPGNSAFDVIHNPIKAIARNAQTTITMPASHETSRFTAAVGGFALLGKLGDVVEFQSLPASLQREEVAAAFDALVVAFKDDRVVTVSCGSPGEVANEPLLGSHFLQDLDGRYIEGANENEAYAPVNRFYGYTREVHVHTALYAPDQLRQRAAHALVQIFVISYHGLDNISLPRSG